MRCTELRKVRRRKKKEKRTVLGKVVTVRKLVDYRERELSKRLCFLWYSLVTYDFTMAD